jgi:hypothetical protein
VKSKKKAATCVDNDGKTYYERVSSHNKQTQHRKTDEAINTLQSNLGTYELARKDRRSRERSSEL